MSSSYDAALIDTAMIEDASLLRLPRSIRLVHIEAVVWSKLHRSDGFVPGAAISRLTDEPDAEAAATALVGAGLWERADDGWQIARFTDTQMSAARVEAQRASARERYDRWRTQHSKRSQRVVNAVSNAVGNGPARPPAPPARKGRGQKGGGKRQEPSLSKINGRPAMDVTTANGVLADPEADPRDQNKARRALGLLP